MNMITPESFDIPKDTQLKASLTFEYVVELIKMADRPVSLAEVSYAATNNPHYQHLINPFFSGKKNAAKREGVGLYIAFKKGSTAFWSINNAHN